MSASPGRALVACSLLSGALGTIHAYSLFIDHVEVALGVGRAAVSSVYSVALVALTAAVLGGHRVFPRLRPSLLVAVISVGATTGLWLAAFAGSLPVLIVGYGLLFGGFNGLGYAFALQLAGETNPDRRGLAMGAVTSAYALGATVASLALSPLLTRVGGTGGLMSLGATVPAAGLVAAGLLTKSSAPGQSGAADRESTIDRAKLIWFWLAYGLAVIAGLMALGHAAALIDHAGGSSAQSSLAVTVAGIANAIGGAVVALAVDRTRPRWWLVGLPLASAAGLVGLIIATTPAGAIVAVATVALGYGAVIAVYPVAVVDAFGESGYPRAYGRIFTAWGAAGLVGPVGAGAIFDAWGSYTPALAVACAAALLSASVALRRTGQLAVVSPESSRLV